MDEFLLGLKTFFRLTLYSLQAMIFLRVILSWLPGTGGAIHKITWDLTEPVLKPIRQILPATGMFDLSPMVSFFIFELLLSFL